MIELTRAHVLVPRLNSLNGLLDFPELPGRILQQEPLPVNLLDESDRVVLSVSRLLFVLQNDLFVFFDLRVRLLGLLPVVLHLSLHFCASIL